MALNPERRIFHLRPICVFVDSATVKYMPLLFLDLKQRWRLDSNTASSSSNAVIQHLAIPFLN